MRTTLTMMMLARGRFSYVFLPMLFCLLLRVIEGVFNQSRNANNRFCASILRAICQRCFIICADQSLTMAKRTALHERLASNVAFA